MVENEKEKKKYFTNDRRQKFKITFYFLLELFKIIIASVLLLSVIQDCDGQRCTLNDKFNNGDTSTYIVLVVNVSNIFFFLLMYGFELSREHFIINHFDINKELPDNYITHIIDNYSSIKSKFLIHNINYLLVVYILIFISLINWVISGLYIFNNYYNFTTAITFITNILLIITKLYDSYYTATTSNKKKYALSAYIKVHINFNTIDSDFIYKSDSFIENIENNDNYIDISDSEKNFNEYMVEDHNVYGTLSINSKDLMNFK